MPKYTFEEAIEKIRGVPGAKGYSNSKPAREAIQREIASFYPDEEAGDYGVKTGIEAMNKDAEAYGGGYNDWQKGAALVDAGNFRVYHNDQANFLRGIYGDKVDKWDGEKIHNTYKSLIGREYARLYGKIKK